MSAVGSMLAGDALSMINTGQPLMPGFGLGLPMEPGVGLGLPMESADQTGNAMPTPDGLPGAGGFSGKGAPAAGLGANAPQPMIQQPAAQLPPMPPSQQNVQLPPGVGIGLPYNGPQPVPQPLPPMQQAPQMMPAPIRQPQQMPTLQAPAQMPAGVSIGLPMEPPRPVAQPAPRMAPKPVAKPTVQQAQQFTGGLKTPPANYRPPNTSILRSRRLPGGYAR